MPDKKNYYSNSGSVHIEVTSAGGSSGNLSELTKAIKDIASQAAQDINGMSDDQKPQEFEIAFGLNASESTSGFYVAITEATATFRVRMKWSGGGGVGDIVPTPE